MFLFVKQEAISYYKQLLLEQTTLLDRYHRSTRIAYKNTSEVLDSKRVIHYAHTIHDDLGRRLLRHRYYTAIIAVAAEVVVDI